MAELQEITSGLRFPEGPVCLEDGSVLVVEIQAGRLTRVAPDGSKSVVAQTGGGPNGALAAIGCDLRECPGLDLHHQHASILEADRPLRKPQPRRDLL